MKMITKTDYFSHVLFPHLPHKTINGSPKSTSSLYKNWCQRKMLQDEGNLSEPKERKT